MFIWEKNILIKFWDNRWIFPTDNNRSSVFVGNASFKNNLRRFLPSSSLLQYFDTNINSHFPTLNPWQNDVMSWLHLFGEWRESPAYFGQKLPLWEKCIWYRYKLQSQEVLAYFSENEQGGIKKKKNIIISCFESVTRFTELSYMNPIVCIFIKNIKRIPQAIVELYPVRYI